MKLQIEMDFGDMERRLSAMSATLAVHGRAEVMVRLHRTTRTRRDRIYDPRIQRPGEPLRSRRLNNGDIANFLRAKGHDPFEYPTSVYEPLRAELDGEIQGAMTGAFSSGRPQTERVKRALIGTAIDLVDFARTNIISGHLGGNTPKYFRYKRKKFHFGDVSQRYGDPPPYGILTGNFVESIRWRWRRGYRPGGPSAAGDYEISTAFVGRIG